MTDHDLEQMLTQWHPAGPPPALRARVVAGAAPPAVWPVAVAAAALVALAVLLPRMTEALAAAVPPPASHLTRELALDVVAGTGLDADAAARLADDAVLVSTRFQHDDGAVIGGEGGR